MNLEKFEKLDEDKKNRIIEAAMNEFIKEGYTGASTNTIVKSAEISKGALFNYFENKEKLYLYLLNFNLKKLAHNFQNKRGGIENLNLFDGIKIFANTNIEFFTKNPKTFKFLANAINNAPPEIRAIVLKAKRELQGTIVKSLTANAPEGYFRNNARKELIEYTVTTMLDTISNRYVEKYEGNIEKLLSSSEERNREIDEFMNLLKFGILNREEKWKK